MSAIQWIGLGSGIIGGIVGAIAGLLVVQYLGKKIRAHACPGCGNVLGDKKPGKRTWTQILWGGWTCPECGCDVNNFGKNRAA